MFSVDIDRSRRLLVISAAGHVTKEEVSDGADEVSTLLQDIAPGFRVLIDFRWLESMHSSATPHIGAIMGLLAKKKAGLVVRVIPDPQQDIAINVLNRFRYGPEIEIVAHNTLSEALHSLAEETHG